MKKVFLLAIVMMAAQTSFADQSQATSAGPNLKCYDVAIDKASGNMLKTVDLESMRKSESKFVTPSYLGGDITVEVSPSVGLSKGGQSYAYVTVKWNIPHFDITQGDFVNINGKEGSFVGNVPSSDNPQIIHKIYCGFK